MVASRPQNVLLSKCIQALAFYFIFFFFILNWFLGVQLAHLEPPHNNIKRHKAKSVGMEWTDTAAVCSKSLAGGK